MSQLSRRDALRLFASLGAASAAVPVLSACGDSDGSSGGAGAKAKGTVKIGLLIPETGANKPIGDDMRRGFELYTELNGRRLGGYDLQLVTADEGETGDSGKAGMEKLRQQGVVAVSGVASALTMTAVRDIVEQAHIPLLGSNASPQDLLSTLYIWRTSFVDNEPGAALGEYIATQLNPENKQNSDFTTFVIASDVIGRDAIKGFQSTFNAAKGRVEGQPVFVPAGATDFTQWLQPLKTNNTVRAIFAFFSGASAEAFVKQYAALKLNDKIPLYAPGFLTEGTLLTQQGAAARGVYTALNYSPDLDNAANRQFAAEYQRRHRTNPTTYAMASYDAASVLDKALISIERNPSGETLNAAIGKVGQIDSPRGEWQFNGNRSPQQKWYLRQVRTDGQVLSNNVVSQLVTLG